MPGPKPSRRARKRRREKAIDQTNPPTPRLIGRQWRIGISIVVYVAIVVAGAATETIRGLVARCPIWLPSNLLVGSLPLVVYQEMGYRKAREKREDCSRGSFVKVWMGTFTLLAGICVVQWTASTMNPPVCRSGYHICLALPSPLPIPECAETYTPSQTAPYKALCGLSKEQTTALDASTAAAVEHLVSTVTAMPSETAAIIVPGSSLDDYNFAVRTVGFTQRMMDKWGHWFFGSAIVAAVATLLIP